MFRWLAGRGASRRRIERELAQVSEHDWQLMLATLPFLAGLSPEQEHALRQRVAWVLASKSFSGAHGFDVVEHVCLSIAAQAALPILELDPAVYEGWTEIIVYPGGFLIPRSEVDESGVVHEYLMEASGEAWDGGPVILSWADSAGGPSQGANVVIHEFAHKLDLYGGEADGMPSLHAHGGLSPLHWRRVLDKSFERFSQAVIDVEAAIPHNVDPESAAADPWYDTLPLDPYAATDEAEFFAVSSEAFFVNPQPLARQLPEWYGLLASYYRQDPLARLAVV